jgi:hypothetical protein
VVQPHDVARIVLLDSLQVLHDSINVHGVSLTPLAIACCETTIDGVRDDPLVGST